MTNAEIIAKLDRNIPLQAAHIADIQDLDKRGARYSGEDWDIRGAAMSAIGRTEVRPWEAKWVEIWAPRAR